MEVIFRKEYNAIPVLTRMVSKTDGKKGEILVKAKKIEVLIVRESTDEKEFYQWYLSSNNGKNEGKVSSQNELSVFQQGESAPSLRVYLSEDGKLIIKERNL